MRRLLVHMSGLYALAVVTFCAAGVFHDRPDWADATRATVNDVRTAVVAWTSDTAATVVAWFDDDTAQPPLRGTQPDRQPTQVAVKPAPAPIPTPKPQPQTPKETQFAVVPQNAPVAPQVVPQPAPEAPPAVEPAPVPQVAQAEPAPAPQVAEATPTPAPQREARNTRNRMSPNVVTRVRERLRASLSDDLYNNFDLFVYVSKADHGPWAQQMYVFAKEVGELRLVHNFPVSTGREQTEPDAQGRMRETDTPAGYYQFDPNRMLKNYRSIQWDAPMPYAMFFNWIRKGSLTGLAIHGVEGQEIALLGTRASAGCVRLSPDSARALFEMIRDKYRGNSPRFAMGHRRYSTMSNQGDLMRDADGNLVFDRGYRVLVYIDSYGGQELVSALY